MIWLALGCTIGGGGTTTIAPLPSDSGTTDGSIPARSPDLVVTDSNVHSYDADWRFPSIEVRPEIEIFVSWDRIVADAHGFERTPDSFATAVLFEVPGSMPDLVDALAIDTLAPSDRWQADIAGKTELRMSDFAGFDPNTQLVEDDGRTLLLALCDEDGARIDIRDGLGIAPTATQGGTVVSIPNGGAAFSWLGQIDGSQLRTDGGLPAYTVDWSGVTTDGYGKPFSKAQGDELFVGRFDDEDEADDLGSQLLDLSATASGWWTLPVGGATSAVLADATGTDGAFPGFESDVVYVIGVRCTTCLGPAPSWVAGVEVR